MKNINNIKQTVFVILIAVFLIVNLDMPYSLKVDYSFLKHFITAGLAFFVLLGIIELAVYLTTERKKQGYPVTLLLFALFFVIAINIKTLGIIGLVLSNKPYVHSKAFVLAFLDSDHGRRKIRPRRYTLLFPEKQPIRFKKIYISSNGYRAINGECLNVKYRENVLVVEVRRIKEQTRDLTLLQKSQKECLK